MTFDTCAAANKFFFVFDDVRLCFLNATITVRSLKT